MVIYLYIYLHRSGIDLHIVQDKIHVLWIHLHDRFFYIIICVRAEQIRDKEHTRIPLHIHNLSPLRACYL